jgi:cytochrome c551/c552
MVMFFRTFDSRFAAAGLFLAALALPLAGQAASPSAVDMGCYNCHGAYPRGEAPGFPQITAKYAERKPDAAAEQRLADKLRQGEWLEHIDAHERLSPETARALVHWLVEGAK